VIRLRFRVDGSRRSVEVRGWRDGEQTRVLAAPLRLQIQCGVLGPEELPISRRELGYQLTVAEIDTGRELYGSWHDTLGEAKEEGARWFGERIRELRAAG
jgi:hypothetical protein